ncbi:MAG: DUF1972 domain-containing protein [Bacteroidota bacterium]
MKLNIAILGTRGIPNHYGGFEHISQHLATGLVEKGHLVTVYNSHNHPHTENNWRGVQIIHVYDPEHFMGTAGQFIYDFNCLLDARKKNFDVILFMGYTSSSIWGSLFPKRTIIISNMDGLEWKRTKYSKPVQHFLKYAERLAIKYSQFYIADSIVIQSYLKDKYQVTSEYIPYGADLYAIPNHEKLEMPEEPYFLLMARMEPENNIEMILTGFSRSRTKRILKVLGNTQNKFGKWLTKKFEQDLRIQFMGPNFDPFAVNDLQHWSYLYFHGHSVGGTNPSLLQAMANGAPIAAHRNAFNEAVLQHGAFYFSNAEEVTKIVENLPQTAAVQQMKAHNLQQIRLQYNWPKVIEAYEEFILKCYQNNG